MPARSNLSGHLPSLISARTWPDYFPAYLGHPICFLLVGLFRPHTVPCLCHVLSAAVSGLLSGMPGLSGLHDGEKRQWNGCCDDSHWSLSDDDVRYPGKNTVERVPQSLQHSQPDERNGMGPNFSEKPNLPGHWKFDLFARRIDQSAAQGEISQISRDPTY